jgi:hypothetical protein
VREHFLSVAKVKRRLWRGLSGATTAVGGTIAHGIGALDDGARIDIRLKGCDFRPHQ